MNNLFFLEAKCIKYGKVFYPRYDLGADDAWVLTYGEKALPVGQKVGAENVIKFTEKKIRNGPQYKCPWCGNKGYVHCGSCHNITCYNADFNEFTCAYCGNSGEVTGVISNEELNNNIKVSGYGQ